jgi:adenylate cyclase
MADQLHFTADIRLACQTTITGDIKLRRLVLDADDIDMADQLRSAALPQMVGEERRVAILFADIRGFTAFAEKLPPYDVIHALNRYFYRMAQIVRNHHGYVDNYMGDGLLAIFGTTEPETAPLDAVLAGLEMLSAMKNLAPYYSSIYGRKLEIGIGVHYGNVVLGSIGPPSGNRVTAIGDAVNFASRIESANKVMHTGFLISDETFRCVATQVEVKIHEHNELPGRANPCTLYEPIAIKP